MISAEVPIMFSKAIEIFITELSLRAWLHTEEAKRRTVQVIDRQTDRQTGRLKYNRDRLHVYLEAQKKLEWQT